MISYSPWKAAPPVLPSTAESIALLFLGRVLPELLGWVKLSCGEAPLGAGQRGWHEDKDSEVFAVL